jgi:hypothetical protein
MSTENIKDQVRAHYRRANCTFSKKRGVFIVTSGFKDRAIIGYGATLHDAWGAALSYALMGGNCTPPPIKEKEYGMDQVRKTLPQLKTEYDKHRRMLNRTFKHNRTGDNYNLIGIVFDEATNTTFANYCVCSTPWLKFVRPIDEFIDSFTDLGELK